MDYDGWALSWSKNKSKVYNKEVVAAISSLVSGLVAAGSSGSIRGWRIWLETLHNK